MRVRRSAFAFRATWDDERGSRDNRGIIERYANQRYRNGRESHGRIGERHMMLFSSASRQADGEPRSNA